MKGSSTLIFIGLASALLLAFAWKKNGGASRAVQDPGRAATGGTTPATKPATKPAKVDPTKVLIETAKVEATKRGQQAIIDWFAGTGGP